MIVAAVPQVLFEVELAVVVAEEHKIASWAAVHMPAAEALVDNLEYYYRRKDRRVHVEVEVVAAAEVECVGLVDILRFLCLPAPDNCQNAYARMLEQ